MSATLYLLRQQPDRIFPSLFQESDPDMEIVFIEQATSITPSFMKGAVLSTERMMVSDFRQTLTYDELIEKIFSSEHIIVI